ncbi:protein-L-isoaspartate O-methyltransferase [Candidatus Woesearchaeota archaeon]|jgi:protein-L-isoaspartate(D-aspartate) O-methyltransferase|nr:protein-L-isoaspartate O-methyltransferase [Candidatus Woesearchaeota archaeon]MDP6648199.1 protein-L-isoaspartate O-methyltransferase [Candidatus Woesearchaeota archaeon]|tara:strand:- start:30249 stop:30881 length:633 start_codon:yes stop_codon:yes gene_type:complete
MTSKEHLIEHWLSSGTIKDKRIIKAFKKVPREKFIRDKDDEAYGDCPLSIGQGQTISQPTTVMVMTEALELKEGDKVLEVGAGSGYQAAIIANIVGDTGKVISTEIIDELAKFAQENINRLNLKNVKVIKHDGSQGYQQEAPYDKIIVTAACPKIPKPLTGQLKENGIIIAPVGNLIEQVMIKARKINNKLIEENLGQFVFVPLKGKHGH